MTADLVVRAREFARSRLLGREDYFDGLPAVPTPLSAELHRAGLANWWLPVSHGGAGAPLTTGIDLVSELAYGDAGFAFASFLPVLGTTMLHRFGEPALAARHLGTMAREGGSCAILVSEDEAGSELARNTTVYHRKGEDVVISGDKQFSTNTDGADFLLVVARSAEDPSLHSVMLVQRDTPGIEIVRRWDMQGMRGSGTYQVRLRDCVIPAGNVLEGNGLRILEAGLNASRTLIAATAIGISRRIRDLAMEYAAHKRVKGAPLAENAVFAAKLGQIEMLIDVMRNQCLAAAARFDSLLAAPDPAAALYRTGATREALAAKMYCGQAGWTVATMGSELFGGLGYTNGHPITKLVRDLRYVGLVEGGDDVVRDLLYSRYVAPSGRRR
ncbi:acyl-CoA dehydrogenase family protein [Streptomyces sp. NPDC059849]|uniref:acyl-CoA dehydrogenase family protein n=1 Tax=unclassified Streptomyces TaxID=2593676 RepID=UPI0036695696